MRTTLRKILIACACALIIIGCPEVTRATSPPGLTPEQTDAIRQLLHLPPGSEVEITHTKKTSKDGGEIEINESAEGSGASLRASGDKIVQEFDASAPSAGLGNGRLATGSTTKGESSVFSDSSKLSNPLLWVGIVCLLGAGWLVYRTRVRAAMITAGVGFGMIACALFPAVALFIVAAAVIALVIAYVHREDKAKDYEPAKEALRAVAAGISEFEKAAKDPTNKTVPADVYPRLTSMIKAQATAEDIKTITTIKLQDNL